MSELQDHSAQSLSVAGRRLVLVPTVLKRIPFSEATMWREIAARRFPGPVKIAARRVAFFEDEIVNWLTQRIAERDARRR
jgi:predicted DNA-binding transcriptional regulator AlpA